ncbi:hypothetical protein B279_07115 [Streptococcus equinus ATCC 33317]|nr:hypothetical protein [Streptococcus equinus]KFN85816.1 hypothetical protein B279_07115 [Streptococcus equinus ATCC 33317]SEN56926.1 hypothetical protein SAMN04488496_0421 [Streptococcus equinus]
MAGRIQGITAPIGDTTKLQTALKGVNTEIRNTQSQLRDADKLLKLDPGNMELLAQKHRLNVLKELMIVLKRLAYLSLTQINALDVGFVQDNVQWKLSQ